MSSSESANASSVRLVRHGAVTRINHWLMAVCMIVLLLTAFLPILGIQFDWVTIHWIAGLIFFVSVSFHTVYALIRQDWRSMWIALDEFADIVSSMSGSLNALKVTPGKYWIMQKIYHHSVAFLSLIVIITGILMLFKIDIPFWERNPYIFSNATWGVIYVLHGFSALFFIPFIMMHIYFAFRPEKLFYTRSMIRGWITGEEYRSHHDPQKWVVEQSEEEEHQVC
ncbi:MAG: cytochrome b/b6 domain-containing protein [Candidatus Latescibacteria bacterium]|jgi:cytochrome b subunit of formate dehydrogenase|nr:cytochrome b/b6 domain-containing protein [Candidatus Latescibacterota bacterium]